MIFTPLAQNDKQLNSHINKAGCLFRCLSMGAEWAARKSLSADEIETLYTWLIDHGDMRENCWVLDHERVIKAAQHYLDADQKALYVFRNEADSSDFETGIPANFYIRHIRTANGTGHFYVCNADGHRLWDPYWPTPEVEYVMGIRGYRIG